MQMNRVDHDIYVRLTKEICSTCSSEKCGPWGGWKFCQEFAERFLKEKTEMRRKK